jgi:hypothetical protein
MLDWLGQAVLDGRLNGAQKKRFFEQVIRLQLSVRPVVALGEPIPYRVNHQARGPSGGQWWVRVESLGATIDGRAVPGAAGGSSSMSGLGGGGSTGSWLPCDEPGRHTIEVTQRVQVFHGPAFADVGPPNRKLFEQDVALIGVVEVSAERDAGGVRLVADPTLRQPILASLRPRDFEIMPGSDRLSGFIEIQAVPADVAFEIVVRAAGVEQVIGTITQRKGTSTHHHVAGEARLITDMNLIGEKAVDVVLRPSAQAARRTVELVEIWDGDPLVFEDVPVRTTAR